MTGDYLKTWMCIQDICADCSGGGDCCHFVTDNVWWERREKEPHLAFFRPFFGVSYFLTDAIFSSVALELSLRRLPLRSLSSLVPSWAINTLLSEIYRELTCNLKSLLWPNLCITKPSLLFLALVFGWLTLITVMSSSLGLPLTRAGGSNTVFASWPGLFALCLNQTSPLLSWKPILAMFLNQPACACISACP